MQVTVPARTRVAPHAPLGEIMHAASPALRSPAPPWLARAALFAAVTAPPATADAPEPPMPASWPAVLDALRAATTIRALVEEPVFVGCDRTFNVGPTYEVYARRDPAFLAFTGPSAHRYEWRQGISKRLASVPNRDANGDYVPGTHNVEVILDNGPMVQQAWGEFHRAFSRSAVRPLSADAVEITLPFPWAKDLHIVVVTAPGGPSGPPPLVTTACLIWKGDRRCADVVALDLDEPLPPSVISDPWVPFADPPSGQWALSRWRAFMTKRPGFLEMCGTNDCQWQ